MEAASVNPQYSAGAIDEKIFQRQLMKGELAAAMEGGGGGAAGGAGVPKAAATRFTRDELRDLFRLNTATACETAELLAKLPSGVDWQVGTPYDGLP